MVCHPLHRRISHRSFAQGTVIVVSVMEVEVEAARPEVPAGIDPDVVLRPRSILPFPPVVLQFRPLPRMVDIHARTHVAGRGKGGIKVEHASERITAAERQVERTLRPILGGTDRYGGDGLRIEHRLPRSGRDGVTDVRFQRDRIDHPRSEVEFLRAAQLGHVLPRHLDPLRNGGGILLCRHYPCGHNGRHNSHNDSLHIPAGL